MSGVQTDNKSSIRKLPLIIKKDSIKSGPNSTGISFRCFPSASGNLIKEDIIYESKAGDFLNGKYPDLCIINRLDLTKNSSRTTAAYTAIDCSVVKLSSDSVVELIGQENYDQVFASLCSVINQELKVKGILSLLSLSAREEKEYSTVGSQTYESSYSDLMREKQRRSSHHNKRRGQFKSYAVQAPKPEPVRKVVIHPDDFKHIEDIKVEDQCSEETLPISDKSYSAHIKAENDTDETSRFVGTESYVKPLGIDPFLDESSNISEVGSIGNISVGSGFSFTDLEGKTVSLLNYIDDHTQFNEYNNEGVMSTIVMLDGSKVMVRGNPDPFHIAMPNILKDLSPSDRRKLVVHQSYLDWKFCLLRDEDNNLPIHLAVLNNDLGLLNRQCLMLKSRQESIDILAAGNLTALQIAIFQDYPECTELLLAHGADVLVRDDENRTVLHLAAELGVRHLAAILTHCRKHAREIFKENEDLWTPELENKSEDKLVSYLLTRLSTLCDSQGYTPLMVASKVGNAAAVELLVRAAPGTINMAMPTCGNTALYLVAAAACTESANRGDKTKLPENYKRTVQILIENGADPAIDNKSGSNVHVLLSEFQDTALSAIIANRLAAYNGYGDKVCGAIMLLKDDKGAIKVTEMKKTNKKYVNATTNNGKDKSKPNDKANTKTKKNLGEYKSECVARNNNGNFKININVQPGENVDKSRSANESDKPVILTNLPVVTKIVSFAKDKPVLVKSILVKEGTDNKGLKTKITAKPKTTTSPVNVGSKSLLSTYLKILPKTELETPNSDIITGSGPQTLSKPKLEPPSIESPAKNKRIIVRQELIKRRPKHDYGESAPSSSKIPKY